MLLTPPRPRPLPPAWPRPEPLQLPRPRPLHPLFQSPLAPLPLLFPELFIANYFNVSIKVTALFRKLLKFAGLLTLLTGLC